VPVASVLTVTMPPRRATGKVPGGKDSPDDAKTRPSATVPTMSGPGAAVKPADTSSAWNRPREAVLPRAHPTSPPVAGLSSSATAAAKAKAAAKPSLNIAAQAARNLGGFVPNKIFVGGVPITCTEEQFRNYFEPYGAIGKVELHALRGFGYITYESVEAVDACLEKYEEHYLCKKWVEVKRSIPRELIDAYEREQRRLHAECLASGEGSDRTGVQAEVPGKAEVSTAKVVPGPAPAAAPPASPWGSLPSGGARPKASAHTPVNRGEASGTVNLSRIAQLREMGFSDEVAKRVLSECAWDVNEAIDRLLLSGAMSSEAAAEPSVSMAEPSTTTGGNLEDHSQAMGINSSCNGLDPGAAGSASALVSPGPPPEAVMQSDWGGGAAAGTEGISHHMQPGLPGVSAAPCASSAAVAVALEQKDEIEDAAETEQFPTTADPSKEKEVAIVSNKEDVPLPTEPPTGALTMVHAVAEQSAVPVAETAAGTAGPLQPAPPKKRIQKVVRTWPAEDKSQMSVREGDFVNVWVETGTDNGWIHGDVSHDGTSRVGWLPICVLKYLPEDRQWMRVNQEWQALDESQRSVEAGSHVIVWTATRTNEGWAYAESDKDEGMKPGWVPVFCLEWFEE